MDKIVVPQIGRALKGPYSLWIPKVPELNISAIRTSLEFMVGEDVRTCYTDTPTHLIVPREYLSKTHLDLTKIPIDDMSEAIKFQKTNIRIKTRLWDAQQLAYSSMDGKTGGVLGLACGRGKTVIALHYAASLGVPTIVVVHTRDLLMQWADRASEHLAIGEDQIGLIQGKVFDWQKPLVIASLKTLAQHHWKWPIEFRKHFGLAIYDEVHHMSAPMFVNSADLFGGQRVGLSATPKREDGLEDIYQYHLGPLMYEDYEQELEPEVIIVHTDSFIENNHPAILDKAGQFSAPRLLTWLGREGDRNKQIANLTNELRKEGRTILILTFGRDHAIELGRLVRGSGVCYGDVSQEERYEIIQTRRVIIATMQIGREAIDNKEIDTVIFATPFRAEGMFKQGVGRALRTLAHRQKNQPKVYIISDVRISKCRDWVREMRKHTRKLGYVIKEHGSVVKQPRPRKVVLGARSLARRRNG